MTIKIKTFETEYKDHLEGLVNNFLAGLRDAQIVDIKLHVDEQSPTPNLRSMYFAMLIYKD